jgi:hypothetical protein
VSRLLSVTGGGLKSMLSVCGVEDLEEGNFFFFFFFFFLKRKKKFTSGGRSGQKFCERFSGGSLTRSFRYLVGRCQA